MIIIYNNFLEPLLLLFRRENLQRMLNNQQPAVLLDFIYKKEKYNLLVPLRKKKPWITEKLGKIFMDSLLNKWALVILGGIRRVVIDTVIVPKALLVPLEPT